MTQTAIPRGDMDGRKEARVGRLEDRYEYEHKAVSLLDSEGSVHSSRDVFECVCLRRIQ